MAGMAADKAAAAEAALANSRRVAKAQPPAGDLTK